MDDEKAVQPCFFQLPDFSWLNRQAITEEMLMNEEGMQETPNKLIHIGHPIEFDEDQLFNHLEELFKEAYDETDKMKELVSKLVPTYHITDNK